MIYLKTSLSHSGHTLDFITTTSFRVWFPRRLWARSHLFRPSPQSQSKNRVSLNWNYLELDCLAISTINSKGGTNSQRGLLNVPVLLLDQIAHVMSQSPSIHEPSSSLVGALWPQLLAQALLLGRSKKDLSLASSMRGYGDTTGWGGREEAEMRHRGRGGKVNAKRSDSLSTFETKTGILRTTIWKLNFVPKILLTIEGCCTWAWKKILFYRVGQS